MGTRLLPTAPRALPGTLATTQQIDLVKKEKPATGFATEHMWFLSVGWNTLTQQGDKTKIPQE